MKLYHITLNHNIKKLRPQIPSEVMESENIEIARISASESIEDCFKAVPWNCSYFGKWKGGFFETEEDICITVFEIDTANIKKENLIRPEEVKETYGVLDAEDTTEHWIINEEVEPINKYTIIPLYLREGYSVLMPTKEKCKKCLTKECEFCIDEVTRFLLEDYSIID